MNYGYMNLIPLIERTKGKPILEKLNCEYEKEIMKSCKFNTWFFEITQDKYFFIIF